MTFKLILLSITAMRNKFSSSYINLITYCCSLGLALYVLNFALTFHNVWPTLGITTRHDLSVEIAAIIFLVSIYTWRMGRLSSGKITLLAVLLTLMALARYLEVTAPALFGRRINLYWDAQYIPHVTEMMVKAASPFQIIVFSAGGIISLFVIYILLRLSLLRIIDALGHSVLRRGITICMGLLIVGYTMGHIDQPIHTLKYYSLPLTKTYWEQAEFISSVLAQDANEVLPDTDPLGSFDLPLLKNSDVIVHFFESYGATAYDNPFIANKIQKSKSNFTSAIKSTGRYVVSGFISPPTFGGNSWLSHASFMTGLDVRHLSTYDLMVTQDRPTLADRFKSIGYRSVALMPGMKTEWPEGSFYGFDRIYGEKELDYRGPDFGWWRIPDQYSLAKISKLEIDKINRQPLFLFFTTITPHMPFRPTPPYQPDWSQITSDAPFENNMVKTSLNMAPDWTNLQPAYADTLAYTFDYLTGYLQLYANKNITWIILGDHQPPSSVSGKDVRWDVPVHIISGNQTIIKSLIGKGFIEGLEPSDAPIDTMHQLPVTLLQIFSGS